MHSSSASGSRSPRRSAFVVAAMLAMIVVPAIFTLRTVHLSAVAPTVATTPGASPYGYTVSLLLFVIPVLVITFWFLPQEQIKISQKSFVWTIGLLFPIGACSISSSPATSSSFPTPPRRLESRPPPSAPPCL
ncbi:hypothetical protein [Edaphobacter dinghuensis]|uniref:hypothetical protein n=1 Tax=Edaphobacter dinghuensis TaxID=1560005 RepID=UPI001E43CD86|nr:hypothetical protein [Edaphobacter dinghuensis]